MYGLEEYTVGNLLPKSCDPLAIDTEVPEIHFSESIFALLLVTTLEKLHLVCFRCLAQKKMRQYFRLIIEHFYFPFKLQYQNVYVYLL